MVISEPKRGGYHGAEVAAPVFREISDRAFAMKAQLHTPVNLAPKPKLAGRALPGYDAGLNADVQAALRWLDLDWYQTNEQDEWVVTKPQGDTLWLQPRTVPDKTVPSVVGMGLKDAIYILENRGCRVRVEGVGKVRRQSIAPGTRARGQKVTLYLD